MVEAKRSEVLVVKNVIRNEEFTSTLDELLSILHFNHDDDFVIRIRPLPVFTEANVRSIMTHLLRLQPEKVYINEKQVKELSDESLLNKWKMGKAVAMTWGENGSGLPYKAYALISHDHARFSFVKEFVSLKIGNSFGEVRKGL